MKTPLYIPAFLLFASVLLDGCGKSNTPTPVPPVTPVVTSPAITTVAPASGLLNSSVTITGTNFSSTPANNTVKFNGIAATVTSASATQLVVTVPGAATTGKISITIDGKSVSSTADFKIVSGTVSAFYNAYVEFIAIDASGNFYSTSTVCSNCPIPGIIGILKFSPAGVPAAFAGSATVGDVDGTGSGARFGGLTGLATDVTGNVFVTDNNGVRKITPAGVVTTIAGSGTAGFADGQGAVAQFSTPTGLVLDAAGNIYVVDSGNHCIRKITPTGVVSTLAGSNSTSGNTDGKGSMALFNLPVDIVIDPSGNLFVSDVKNFNIRKIAPDGTVTTFAGSGAAGFVNGTGTAAQFTYPQGMAMDVAGNIFVSDNDYPNNFYYVRMINKAGIVSTFLGNNAANGPLKDAQISTVVNFPDGIAFDPQGNMFFANTGVGIDLVGGSYIDKVTFK